MGSTPPLGRPYEPESPGSGASDTDSDLELTLDELLDPVETSTYTSRPLRNHRHATLGGDHRSTRSPAGRTSYESGPRIALRKLGMGGRSKPKEDDEHGLLDEHQGLRRSSEHHDEAPLLPSPGRQPRKKGSILSLRSSQRDPSPTPTVRMENGMLDTSRVIPLDPSKNSRRTKYASNIISNHRYTPWSFLPLTLYHEFSYFFNLYFLLVALSQIIPPLRIGYLSTYIVPLVFVLCITLGKEVMDDLARRRRDTEANGEEFELLDFDYGTDSARKKNKRGARRQSSADGAPTTTIKSRDIKVGDILVLGKDMRVPADVIILKAVSNDPSEPDVSGESFIRTDQLDGETDWKLRVAPGLSQSLSPQDLLHLKITATPPSKEVNTFLGTMSLDHSYDPGSSSSQDRNLPLSIDNTAWANTVIASNSTIYAAVVYTGRETRQALSTAKARSKTGLLEEEINNLTKILCGVTLVLSIILVILNGTVKDPKAVRPTPSTPTAGTEHRWWIVIMRFLILFSSIIPISLRVNLDMGKSVYARFIEKDEDIKDTIVRTSTIPEELGRVEYLLSDKTGTLTQNGLRTMDMEKIFLT